MKQAGSAVRPDKLRFDFTHPQPLTAEERERVERIVNEKIFAAIPVRTFVTPIDEARKLGAMMLFGEKYGDEVRVVEIDGFSRELCGGTHVRSTAEIGAVRARRARARSARARAGSRRSPPARPGRTCTGARGSSTTSRRSSSRRGARRRRRSRPRPPRPSVEPEIVVQGGTNVIVMEVNGLGAQALLDLSDRFKQRSAPAAVVLASRENGTANLVVNFDEGVAARLSAGDVVKEIAPIVGGGGGGRPTMARAGGKAPEKVPDALARARELIAAALR